MSIKTNLFLCLLIALGFTFNSCADNCANDFNFSVELQDETTALSEAAVFYSNDPSTENCEAYKDAYQKYLDAADDVSSCVPSEDKAAYDASIDSARASLDNLQC